MALKFTWQTIIKVLVVLNSTPWIMMITHPFFLSGIVGHENIRISSSFFEEQFVNCIKKAFSPPDFFVDKILLQNLSKDMHFVHSCWASCITCSFFCAAKRWRNLWMIWIRFFDDDGWQTSQETSKTSNTVGQEWCMFNVKLLLSPKEKSTSDFHWFPKVDGSWKQRNWRNFLHERKNLHYDIGRVHLPTCS